MTGSEFPLVITRTMQAPRALVWDCYAKLEHLKNWWGPAGFAWIDASLDFRPGGKFHYGMKAPNGMEMWGRFIYREIEAPARLTFISSFSDAQGGIAAPGYPNMEDFPREVLNEVLFEDKGGQTLLTLRGGPFNASQAERKFYDGMLPSMNQGFAGTLAQFEAYLARLQENKAG